MRRIFLTITGIIVGSTTLFALYVAWDYNPDDVTPHIEATSYRQLFENGVARTAGKPYSALNEVERINTLGKLIASGESEPVREVALYEVRTLNTPDKALTILAHSIDNLSPTLYEVAVESLVEIGTPESRAFLDSLYTALDTNAAAHTPLGGYRNSALFINTPLNSTAGDVALSFHFQEQQRKGADYSVALAPEITLFFPTNPTYIIAAPNFDDAVEALEDSQFGNAFQDTPTGKDILEAGPLRMIGQLRKRIDNNLGFLASFFYPENLLRDNVMIGKYGNDILIAGFKDKNASIAEFGMSVMETFGKKFGIHQWNVGETEVESIKAGPARNTVSIATVGDFYVIATDTALIRTALETHAGRQQYSIGIDPVFQQCFNSIVTDEEDDSNGIPVAMVWFNPTERFGFAGAEGNNARKLAILTAALGKRNADGNRWTQVEERIKTMDGNVAALSVSDNPMNFWRYIVDVRSVGTNAIDSLAHIVDINIDRDIIPHLAPTITVGYFGVEYLKERYGYSNTSFNVLVVIPLNQAQPGFDSTLLKFFATTTTLAYTPDSTNPSGVVWIAQDTTTNDLTLLQKKPQPSFAILNDRLLLIASTPDLLRLASRSFADISLTAEADSKEKPTEYCSGNIWMGQLGTNASEYLQSYLLTTNKYPPAVIKEHIKPIETAFVHYRGVTWSLAEQDGIRSGDGWLTLPTGVVHNE